MYCILMEVSLTNSWIIVESCKTNNSISHSKFRERLVMVRVGDCHQCQICGQGGGASMGQICVQGGGASTNRMTLTIWQRAETVWEAACNYSINRGKTQGHVYCAQKVKCQAGGEKQLYFAIRVFSTQDFVWEHVLWKLGGLMKESCALFMPMGLMTIFL